MNDSNDIQEIMRLLPHRYPFLLVDRILELTPGKKIQALKNVTVNEPFFQGHFPRTKIMPGVLLIEAMAQASGLLVFRSPDNNIPENSLYLFVGVDKARFKRPVVPGDQLVIEVTLLRRKQNVGVFNAEITVDNELVASAEIMCTFQEFPDEE